MKKFWLPLLMSLVLSACNYTAKPSDPLVTIETSPGKEFKLVIESNPTTGYHWEIVGDLDNSIVELVSKDYQPDLPQTTGSGGVDVWIFKAVGPGVTQITLGSYPPSNDATQPVQIETFNVTVK